jgi:hypothetical protein
VEEIEHVKESNDMNVKEPTPQYPVNQKGEKEFFVLPVRQYNELIEDLYDLALMDERKNEPRISYKAFVGGLKKDGLLSN